MIGNIVQLVLLTAPYIESVAVESTNGENVSSHNIFNIS